MPIRLKIYSPHHVVLGAAIKGVGIGTSFCRNGMVGTFIPLPMHLLLPDSLALAINEQLYFICLVVIAPHIYLLTRKPVPVRKEMKNRLLRPFTLIHIMAGYRQR